MSTFTIDTLRAALRAALVDYVRALQEELQAQEPAVAQANQLISRHTLNTQRLHYAQQILNNFGS